jgi:GNAT superfamily N-acetyltransferase
MRIEVSEEPIADLTEYARIPIAFEVSQVFDVSVQETPRTGFVLSDRRIDGAPYLKDYDAIEGEGPRQWAQRFDLSNWGLFVARIEGRRVGGAAVACDTPALNMLEGRSDLAVLWDIRVAPSVRGEGIGSALFRAVEVWATARGCSQLKVETQNINVPACRFYARQGCVLEGVHRGVYPGLPGEIQLLWYKDLCNRMESDARPVRATRGLVPNEIDG